MNIFEFIKTKEKPAPNEADMNLKQNILLKFEDNFSLLDSSIDEDYKKWQEYSKQLDDLEIQLEEAPPELQFKLSNDYNRIKELHNALVDKLKATTKQQEQVKKEYDLVRGSYEKDIDIWNKSVEAENKETKQNTPIIEGLPMSTGEDKPVLKNDIEAITGINPEVGAKETKEITSTLQDYTKAKKDVWGQWFKELKESDNKWSFLKGEGYSEELKGLSVQDIKQSQIASEKGVNPDDWVRTGVYAGFFAMMASEIIPIVKEVSPEIIKNIFYKVGEKNIGKEELQNALYHVTKGDDTPAQRAIFDVFIKAKDAGVPFLERLKGVKLTTVEPRFPFGRAKLYAGLPADEIAKSIIEVGKVTAEAVDKLGPAKAIKIYQTLMNTSPALASEFLKAVEKPEIIPETKTKEQEYSEKYNIPLEKVKVTEVPKADVTKETVGEETINKLEEQYGTKATPEEVLKKVKEAVEPTPKTIPKELEGLAEEARKYKSAEEFVKNISKPTRPIREAKVGELVTIQSDTYGETSPTQYNISIPRDGEIVKINPKSVSIKVGENIYKFPETAKVSALDLKELKGKDKQGIIDFYNQATAKPITEQKAVVEPVAEKAISEEVEAEPTPEEIQKAFPVKEDFNALDTTDKNKELFFDKYNQVYTETKKGYEKIINDTVADLKKEGFQGVEKGGLRKDEEGYVVGKYGATSNNPQWYRDFYEANGKAPTNKDLREIAIQHLLQGHKEDYGVIPANQIFTKLESQLESYDTILSDIKGGDYSFETPSNIGKLNNKLKELGKDNKKLIKDYEAELTTLKAEKANKYRELRKEAEARVNIDIKEEIKKGVKQATTGRKYAGLSEAEIKQGNQLIGQIHKIANQKGLTKKELTNLKRQYGMSPHLATATKRMSIPQLEAVLKAVNRARPKRIGYKDVITPKTESKIQSLKDNLIDKLQMTEEAYKAILKSEGVYKEPRYIDAKNFITEKQGKDVIYRLIDESNILKITMPYEKAVAENKPIKNEVDKLNTRIEGEADRRLKDPHELNSMRLYIQKMETITGAPFYALYQDLINAHLRNKQKLGQFIKEFEPYKKIITDKEAIKRVDDYIVAKSGLKGKPEIPAGITDKEIKLAKKIQNILKDYEARARTEKFLDNIDHPEDMPQYVEYKDDINKAKDIYESKGYDDLVEYMGDQEWGIIKSGYSPLRVITPKVREYQPSPQTFGKSHIKVRTDIEYHEQDKDIIQRLFSYKKQMDNLVDMRPKVRALITLVDKNLDKFKDPTRIASNIEAFFRELKGYNKPENWFDRGLNRLYAQAMQTIIMPSPVLSGRNLLQNVAFGHDKTILIDPRNKKLTDDELDYLNTYISQIESMKADWLMVGEKPLPGLGILTKIVQKIGIYPYSDLANRHWGYWGKINQVNRAFTGDKSLDKKMAEAKFSDMELTEQKMALQILAKDGEEEMARYVARVYVDNTQFLYDRSQRSPAEMGRVGRWAGNLMLFPRAYWEMLLKQSKKFAGKDVPFNERLRAFKVIANIIIGGIMVDVAFKKVTGRQQGPYDPIALLAYEPGGLAIGTAQAVTDVYTNILMASKGDERALAALTTAIPAAADMFIPFYSYALRGIEASTDTKNIDRKALRKLRMLIDSEYAIRGGAYILERNAIEKWQYFLSGAGIDVSIQEKQEKEKKTTKKIKKPEILNKPLSIKKPKVLKSKPKVLSK